MRGLELRRRGRRSRWLGGGRLLVDPEFVDVQPRDLQVLDLEAADRRSSDHQSANRQGADGSGADSRCPGRGRADADRCQKHRRRLLAAATQLHRTVGASTVHVMILLLVRLGVAERAQDQRWRPASAAFYRAVAGARVELLPGVGHSPMLEDPPRTAALLRTFTSSVLSGQ